MTTANALTPKEVAALTVIGDKILSGRTKDGAAARARNQRCRNKGSAMKSSNENSSHTPTIACIHQNSADAGN